MNVLAKLWKAIENLANGLNALADTAQLVNDEMRQRIGLDLEPRSVPQLPEPAGAGLAESNGHEPATRSRKKAG